MLGFEHPSHMVTHPSTDEAQCCLSLEIFVNSAKKKKEERRKKEDENRIKSPLRIEGTNKVDVWVTVAFRNTLVCKKCQILPRPETEVMCCSSCKNILCGKCCGLKCPLFQQESKNQNFSAFFKDPELMVFLSGLKP